MMPIGFGGTAETGKPTLLISVHYGGGRILKTSRSLAYAEQSPTTPYLNIGEIL